MWRFPLEWWITCTQTCTAPWRWRLKAPWQRRKWASQPTPPVSEPSTAWLRVSIAAHPHSWCGCYLSLFQGSAGQCWVSLSRVSLRIRRADRPQRKWWRPGTQAWPVRVSRHLNLVTKTFLPSPQRDAPILIWILLFQFKKCLLWKTQDLNTHQLEFEHCTRKAVHLFWIYFQQTSVEAAFKWALIILWGLPTPTGWTPTTRRSPTSWQALPTPLSPGATWACQGRAGKIWWSGASVRNKPEGKLACLDANWGYVL